MNDDAPPSHVLVVLNPTSGGGAGARVRGEVERELRARGIDFRLETTRGAGHARDLAGRAAEQGVPAVVAAGGDGTVHEVANGLVMAGGETALGLIPIGTGNDFVKVVPGTRRRSAAYDTLANGRKRTFDAARAAWDGGSEVFVNAAGTGIDVEVVRQIEALKGLPGAAKYLTGLVRALMRYRPVRMRVTAERDGTTIDCRVMLSAVSNGRCLGGVFRLTPDAEPDDGLLDLCVVEELGLVRALGVVGRVLRGSHTQHPSVTMLRDRAFDIVVNADGPVFLQLDGELRSMTGDRVHIEALPGALNVISGI